MATKTTNLLANLPDNLTIRKVNEHFDYTELFLEYPEERICPNFWSFIRIFSKKNAEKNPLPQKDADKKMCRIRSFIRIFG